MTPEDERQVRELVEAVRQRDPAEREAFLDGACVGKSWLRAEVAARLDLGPAADIRGQSLETRLPSDSGQGPLDHALDGRRIGAYLVRQELGRGGMGVVYLADDTRLSRRVALKAIAPELSRNAGARERLRQEARAAAALSHPGIATVYALEEIGADLYLACEYVPGRSLRALLQAGRLPAGQVVEIATQLAKAMAVAHAHGITHRDLKPENVVRTPAGVVKILDFGLARIEGAASTFQTQTGVIVGTPAYMAPEQARGETADFRSDVFSFGLLVYEMVSGRNPFVAATMTGTIARILETHPAPLVQVQPDCPQDLDRIVANCLRKDPVARYESTDHLVADLVRLEPAASGARVGGSGVRRLDQDAGARSSRLTLGHWWMVHQAAVVTVCGAMLYPAWRVQTSLPRPYGLWLWFAVLACVASTASLRLHLVFTVRVNGDDLPAQLERTLPWVRRCDAAFCGALLVLAAVGINRANTGLVMLLVAVSTILLVTAFVIEPATTAAAMREHKSGSVRN